MSIKFLSGTRFNEQSNDVYRLRNEPDFFGEDFAKNTLPNLIENHLSIQVPRLQELKRYFLSDNNINYRPNKKDKNSADNRIASAFAEMIVVMRQGQMLGNPLQYRNDNDGAVDLVKLIETYNKRNNMSAHDIDLFIDACIFGRGYELNSVENDDAEPDVSILDPTQTFIVFDLNIKANSLFAVRHFKIFDETIAQVYTRQHVITYVQKDNAYVIDDVDSHMFDAVPVTEYNLNKSRRGLYEAILAQIDAYDLSVSELANYQQNANAGMLVINGAMYTPPRLKDESDKEYESRKHSVMRDFRDANLLILQPDKDGKSGSARYIMRDYSVEGFKEYISEIKRSILQFTFTPDTSDSQFSGVQSGESQKYKLMASDNARTVQQQFFRKGVMRRLRLAANVWRIKKNAAIDYDAINQTNIIFTENIPRTEREIIQKVKELKDVVSTETLLEMLKDVTGIDSETELERILNQK